MHLEQDEQIYLLSQENNRLQETVYLLEQKLRLYENEYSSRKLDVDKQLETLKQENNQLNILKSQYEIQLDNLLNSYNIQSKKNQELELQQIKCFEIRNQFDYLKQEIEKEQRSAQKYKEIALKKKNLLSTLNQELIQLKKSLEQQNQLKDIELQNEQLRANNQEMINTIQQLQIKSQAENEKLEAEIVLIRDQFLQISEQTRQLQVDNKQLSDQITLYQLMEKELQILVEWSESRQNKDFGPFKSNLVKKTSQLIVRLIGIAIEVQQKFEDNQKQNSQLLETNQLYQQQLQKLTEEQKVLESTIIAIKSQWDQQAKANDPEQINLLLGQALQQQFEIMEKDIQAYNEISKNEQNQLIGKKELKIQQLQQQIYDLNGLIKQLQKQLKEEQDENTQLQMNQANFLRLGSKPSQDSNRRSSYSCDNTEGMMLKQQRKIREIESEVDAINELVYQLF